MNGTVEFPRCQFFHLINFLTDFRTVLRIHYRIPFAHINFQSKSLGNADEFFVSHFRASSFFSAKRDFFSLYTYLASFNDTFSPDFLLNSCTISLPKDIYSVYCAEININFCQRNNFFSFSKHIVRFTAGKTNHLET